MPYPEELKMSIAEVVVYGLHRQVSESCIHDLLHPSEYDICKLFNLSTQNRPTVKTSYSSKK